MFMVIGLGSVAFHATLKHAAQLLDEIPMIICVSQACFLLFEGQGTVAKRRKVLATAIAVLDITFVAS